jgi:hypothetical protein
MAIAKISERLKFDVGLVGQTINNSNATGPYYDMRGWSKAALVCIDGANVVSKVTKVEFLQATAAAGTGAKVVKQGNSSTGTESSASNTAAATKLSNVTKATVTLSSAANSETLTITDTDGTDYVFTAHTNTTDKTKRQFKIDGTDAQDATVLYGILTDADYGVPGLSFSDDTSGVITITVKDAGEGTFSVSTNAVTHLIPAMVEQVLYSEIDVGDLDLSGGFYWVACKVTKAGTGIVGATLIRQTGDFPPDQAAAAGTCL